MADSSKTLRHNSTPASTGGRRLVLLFSILLNVGLAFWLAVVAKNHFQSGAAVEQIRFEINHVVRQKNEGREPAVATNPPAEKPPFQWSEIETNDFEAFAANLRSVECPEKTIRDILLPHLQKAFEAERDAIAKETKSFWRTRSQREMEQMQRKKKISAAAHAKKELAQKLFGFEYNSKGLQEWYRETEMGWFFGFLSEEKCERLSCRGEGLEAEFMDSDNSLYGVTTPEDLQHRKEFYQRARATFARDLSPTEADELELRSILMTTYIFHSNKIKEMKVTGIELRQITAIERNIFDPLEVMMLNDEDEQIAGMEKIWKKEFARQVEAYLGETRFQDYLRANDPDYSQMCAATEKLKLPPDTAKKLYQIKQMADDEADQVRQSPELRRRERKNQLQQIQEQTENAVAELVGEQTLPKYRKEFGGWLKELGK